MPIRSTSAARALAAALSLWALFCAAAAARGAAREPPVGPRPPAPLFPDLNRAPVGQLLLLPRVGPARAAALVAARARDGPFRDVADAARVSGIGPATVALLRRAAVVGPPEVTEAGR